MPELPEVEVTRRSFAERIEGAEVTGLRLGAPLRWPLGCEPERLVGTTVGATIRRGKYLWLPLHRPSGAAHRAGRDASAQATADAGGGHVNSDDHRTGGGLLMHLGMSGSLAFADELAPAGRHDHFDLVTSRGLLRLTDPRRFGAVVWSSAIDAHPAARLLARLGAEPFDPALDDAVFHAALKRRRAPIKQVLLAGDVVVGAGNIYACEALFVAAIHPLTPADRISLPRAGRLLQALREVLGRALDLGGSTLRDFRDTHGMAGGFQLQAQVYGRAGQPCPRCGATLRRRVTGQRSTFYCPACQKR